jgi:ubiquinone/menaquinone biosynthesis C-methylase UbiE
MERAESVESSFSAAAARYVSSPIHQGGPDLDAMVEAASLQGHERVLDIGSGPGHAAFAFAPRVRSAVAFDLSEAMLAEGRRLGAELGIANVGFEQGDAAALPFEAGSFEVVTSRYCAHHYADPGAVFREVARVLAPGGVVLVVDSVSPPDPAQDTFLNAIEVLRDPTHVRNYSVAQWTAMLADAGLPPEHLGDFPRRLEFGSWVERIGTRPAFVTALRELISGATDEIRSAFAIRGESCDWDIPVALLRGRAGD